MRDPMGFFTKVGRQVEQFKQTAKKTAEENTDYRCRACDSASAYPHLQAWVKRTIAYISTDDGTAGFPTV